MSKPILRALAWIVLLGSAAGAIVAGIVMAEQQPFSWLLLLSHGPGPMVNWSLFFVSLAIASSVYLLRGVESGKWSLTTGGALAVLSVAVTLLVLGIAGLVVVGVVSTVAAPILIRRRSMKDEV